MCVDYFSQNTEEIGLMNGVRGKNRERERRGKKEIERKKIRLRHVICFRKITRRKSVQRLARSFGAKLNRHIKIE